MTYWGKFLRKYRIKKGERLYDMAKRLNISCAELCGMETGRIPFTEKVIEKLVEDFLKEGAGMFGGNRIIDAEFEELEPAQGKKPAKKNKKWIREIFIFCACMLAALLFSRILGLFIYGK